MEILIECYGAVSENTYVSLLIFIKTYVGTIYQNPFWLIGEGQHRQEAYMRQKRNSSEVFYPVVG